MTALPHSSSTFALTSLYAPIAADLAIVEEIFDGELVSDLPFIGELCGSVRSYRGKMLRPALLLLVAKEVGGLRPVHHTLAAVVEMVHMATLVHDDVLDEADERRGRAPVNAMVGNVAAVLLGDYLISHAFHLCSGIGSQEASRRIGATTNVVCAGELLQNHHRGDVALTEETYFQIVRDKTGALTAVACELGARFAEADHAVVEAMRLYGLSLGVAFQIVDDVLDVLGDRRKVRKTLGLDLSLGKLTLPTIHCLRHASEATAAALRETVAGRRVVDREELRAWLNESNSIDYAIAAALEYVALARRQVDRLSPSDGRDGLAALAEFTVQRQF